MSRTPYDDEAGPAGPDELELRRRLRQLPREREPARDLWVGIEARIGRAAPAVQAAPRRRRAALWTGLALAASLGAVALLAVRLGPPPAHAPVAATPPPAGDARAAPAAANALRREADALSLEYRLALQAFDAAALPPSLQAAVVELDASAEQLRSALREQPEAPYLLARLRHTYDQRLRLTQRGALG